MAYTPGSGATITLNVDGANASTRDIDTVGDALRRLNDRSLQGLNGQIGDADRGIAGLRSSVGELVKLGLTVGAVTGFAAWVHGAIEAADSLRDLSKTTGITVEVLSGLRLASKQTGADLEATAKAINKLSVNIGKDSEKFAKLGITAKDPVEAFKQFADVFNEVEDTQKRAAFAATALGKSWEGAAPLLSEGSAKIAEMIERGQQLSGITTQMSDDADEFNDALAEMSTAAEALSTKVATAMLPILKELSADIGGATGKSDGLSDVFAGALAEAFRAVVILGGNVMFVLKAIGNDIGGMAAQLAALGRGDFTAFSEINERIKEDAIENRKQFDAWEKRILEAGKGIKAATDQAVGGAVSPEKAAGLKELTGLIDQFTGAADEADKKTKEAADRAAAAKKKEEAAYASLSTAVNERIAASERELAGFGPLTEAQKLQIALTEKLASGQLVLTAAHKAAYQARVELLAVTDAAAARSAAEAKAVADYAAAAGKSVADANAEALKNEELVRTFGMTKAAIEQLTIARMADRIESLRGMEGADDKIAELELVLAAKQRNAKALAALGNLEENSDVAKAKDLLDILVQVDEAAQSAAASMAASFGRVGEAIGGLTTALSGYGRAQQAIEAQLAAVRADKRNSPEKVLQAELAASKASAQAKVKSYGDMASAAKGFFKENTTGYKVMEATEKAFRAAEMAMAVKNMLEKSGLLTAFTGLFVASKATETAAEGAATTTSNLMAGKQASAWGITAVVKAIASMPFPLNLAAGAATLAAVVAVGAKMFGGSFGGGQSAAQVQEKQGTGTVFGDSAAKSNSIGASIERLEKHSGDLVPINVGMLNALRSIEASMKGLTNLIVRVPGLVEGENMGIQTGQLNAIGSPTDAISRIGTAFTKALFGPGIGDKIAGFINNLWGKVKSTIVDSGVQFGGSVRALQGGQGFNQYASVDTTKSSWFGLSKKTTNRVETQGLGSELSSQFALIFKDAETALGQTAVSFGGTVDQVKKVLDGLTIEKSSISLKGLSGEALTKAINAVISKALDQMSAAVFPQMDQFRQVGEGYTETVIRLASNYATLDASLASIGGAFGATGTSSLVARERLISLVGGIDQLAAQASSFADNFLSEAERLAPVQKYVTEELSRLGYAGVKTRDDFKNAVLGLVNSGGLATASGAETYAALMKLQAAFAAVTPAVEDMGKSVSEIASEARGLQDRLDELTMTRAQLLAKERAQISAGNRALFDQVKAAERARAAQDALVDSLGDVVGRMKSFAEMARSLRDGLLLGGLSPLTSEQKYAEARQQYDRTVAAARGGDAKAQADFSSVQSAFLSISQLVNGGDAQYQKDFAAALQTSDELAQSAQGQADIGAASLEALNAQVDGISQVNLSVQEIVAQIAALNTALTTPQSFPSPINPANYGGPGTEALLAEIRALRAQLERQTALQQQGVADQIASNAQITAQAADAMVSGVQKVSVEQLWQSRNPTFRELTK